MAFVSSERSRELMRRLAAAVGLAGKPVQKLVIEVEAGRPVKVYAKMLAEHSQVEQVCELFEVVPVSGVTVADDCTVVLTPAE